MTINITELRRLLEAATGTRWSSEGAHVFVDEAYQWSSGPTTIASCSAYADAKLIAALRNAADFLLRAAEERDAYANGTLKWIQDKETD